MRGGAGRCGAGRCGVGRCGAGRRGAGRCGAGRFSEGLSLRHPLGREGRRHPLPRQRHVQALVRAPLQGPSSQTKEKKNRRRRRTRTKNKEKRTKALRTHPSPRPCPPTPPTPPHTHTHTPTPTPPHPTPPQPPPTPTRHHGPAPIRGLDCRHAKLKNVARIAIGPIRRTCPTPSCWTMRWPRWALACRRPLPPSCCRRIGRSSPLSATVASS